MESKAGCRTLPWECLLDCVVLGLVTPAGSPGKIAPHAEVLVSGHIWELRLAELTP